MATISTVATTEVSSSLVAAQQKLAGRFPSSALPQTRDDEIWGRIETDYSLTLDELSALKNYACPARPRGVLPGIQGGGLYRISDERVRSQFIIKNQISPSRCLTMPAELMVDSGAQSELKLPARKIVQLGLTRVGPPMNVRGSTNHVGAVLNFSPVLLSATFDRDGFSETVEAYLTVRADKDEYEEALANANSVEQADDTQEQPPFVTAEEPPRQQSNTDGSPSSDSTGITVIRLSPARHRPRGKPNEQAVIGINGLKKLRMHINTELQQLEIEEEEVLDPEW